MNEIAVNLHSNRGPRAPVPAVSLSMPGKKFREDFGRALWELVDKRWKPSRRISPTWSAAMARNA
jgi:hypothetical protein